MAQWLELATEFEMSEDPENLVLQVLRAMRGEIAALDAKVGASSAELKADMNSLRADVSSDLLNMQKDTREQISGLRRTIVEYHSSVVGHGILISELEERVRRVEQHLNLPPLKAH